MERAPLYHDIANGPEGGSAHWLSTSDGVRIRAGYWPEDDAKGTILIFPGRTEFVEKYGMTAKAFQTFGYASLAIDWRGQGIGSRLLDFAEKRIFRETPNAFICASSFNSQVQRLYQRLGYEVVGDLKDYMVAGHSEILYRKSTGPRADFDPARSTLPERGVAG